MLTTSHAKVDVFFNNLRLPNLIADKAFEILDDIREVFRGGHAEMTGARFADSQWGKSTLIKMYIEKRIVRYCRETGRFPPEASDADILEKQRVFLFVELSSGSTLSSLIGDLLEQGFRDPFPHSGTINKRMARLRDSLAYHRPEAICFDDINHLGPHGFAARAAHKRDAERATNVHNQFKRIVIDGYPIIFLGLREYHDLIYSDRQLSLRVKKTIPMRRLDLLDEGDKQIFLDFLSMVLISLFDAGILDHLLDISEFEEYFSSIHVASGGA
jgi:hypothetical protein